MRPPRCWWAWSPTRCRSSRSGPPGWAGCNSTHGCRSPPLASALLAEDGAGNLVGLAAYSFLWPAAGSSHSLFLKELYVSDTIRRQGVGARFMAELRALAEARPGCSRVEWMTDRDNPDARAFCKSLGFDEFGGKIVYRVDSGPA
ncbi:GNAT family N-acetyltransferase [Streptomyces sp. AVP053U2]|uniref:GNAT family N-acetyltransferase n=1 Tax=Streptomyces sp. AVP053U2 TaxID=1737066 RepID=UPI00272CF402|nr:MULTISPECIES: GNAT family N-acetyltransferase [unclassified Streptomyces]